MGMAFLSFHYKRFYCVNFSELEICALCLIGAEAIAIFWQHFIVRSFIILPRSFCVYY